MSKAKLQRWWSGWRALHGQQRGQSLVIVTFAFIGILAFVGLAIDLGWVYVERVRVAQAADAAALAGASELPLDGAALARRSTCRRMGMTTPTRTMSSCSPMTGIIPRRRTSIPTSGSIRPIRRMRVCHWLSD